MDAYEEIPESSTDDRPWYRRHPVWSAVLLAAVLLLTDIAFLPLPTLLSYRTEQPAHTAFQQADLERQERAGSTPRIKKQWVPYRQMPKHLVRAVLVLEDASFWQRSGFDTFEIHRSITEAMTEGRDLRGASTISQQLVKNLFLSPSRNPLRKYHEVILTIAAEQVLGKRRILELYLNEIEWGKGIYGAQAAAVYHFGKPVTDITAREAAFLAAIIPSPTRYTPGTATNYLERKIGRTLRLMGTIAVVPDSAGSKAPVPPADTTLSPQDQTDTTTAYPYDL